MLNISGVGSHRKLKVLSVRKAQGLSVRKLGNLLVLRGGGSKNPTSHTFNECRISDVFGSVLVNEIHGNFYAYFKRFVHFVGL